MDVGRKPCAYTISGGTRYDYTVSKDKLPNFDPYSFRIIFEKQVGTFLVAMILYPDATNFDGLKVVLLKDTTTLRNIGKFDPHFFEDGNLVARFLPDESGWELAIRVAEMLVPKD